MHWGRTQGLLLVPVVAFAVLLAARSEPTPPVSRPAATTGSEEYFTGRQLAYLTFATSEQHPGSVANVVMHMERARVDPSYAAPLGLAGPDAWDSRFAKIADLEDTSDFDMLYLLNAYLGYRGDPVVAPELWQKTEDAILGFKFWYDQPTPDGVIDDMWYWSENHQIIFHTLEYLAGQTFPNRTFATTGMTGVEHREHARAKILDWLDHTASYGFKEWHSNVYYQKDVTPLLTLVEFADEEEIRTRAAMILDLVLMDLAMHTYRGAFGATHGRTYKKDKMSALDEDTFNLVKLLFDETEYEFTSTGDAGAFLLARAQRYRLPRVLLEIAKTEDAFADRERMGLPYDELANPQEPYLHPYGFDLEDEANIALWWSMQNYTTWQGIPLLFDVADRYGLWETDLFQSYRDLRDAVGGSVQFAQSVAYGFRYAAPLELLKEVDTYTYRTADYMLSTVQDYRKGGRGAQYHAWQATFDANAQVFTTHPGTPSRTFTSWGDDGEPGAWTGTASMPRSAQHENVGIHLYSPQYEVWPDPGSPFYPLTRYEPYTHAYFPQDHFDEVTDGGTANWTFGRFRDGYIALYSWRPTAWIQYDPVEVPTNGMVLPFELRAEGGPDNVWVVECGSLAEHGSFEAFQSLFRDDLVTVTPVTTGLPMGAFPPFFQVVYESPSQGHISFGWEDPLVVAGMEVPISDYPRYDNPWANVPFFERNVRIWDPASRTGLEHDHDIPERRLLAKLDQAQQTCVRGMSKNAARVARVQLEEIALCLEDHRKQKLTTSFEDCLTADRKGRVGRAQDRTLAEEDGKCGLLSEWPPFGSTDAATANAAAVDGALALLHALLGDPVQDTSLHTNADDRTAAACQRAMLRRANKLSSAFLTEVTKLKKRALEDAAVDGVDALEARIEVLLSSNRMISKARQKLVKSVDKECRLAPAPDVMFPGGCADSDLGNVEECVIAAAQCQACLTLNGFSGLDLDCEQLDDGSGNGSCP